MSITLTPQMASAPPRAPVSALPAAKYYGPAFALFLLLNFILYVRPTEVIQPLLGLELYLVVIVICLITAFPLLWQQLQPAELHREPLTVCVIGLTAAVFLSLLSHLQIEAAFAWGFDFFKMLLFYLLFVGLVTDKVRLRRFLWCVTLFISMSALLSVLEFHGVITLPVAASIKDGDYVRLRGSGIFQDPNDLCVLLCLGLLFGTYLLTDRRSGFLRFLWLGPLTLLFYALLQTQSRGGLLALMVGVMAVLRARWGWLRAALLGLVVVPLLLAVAAGRQAGISATTDTGQARMELWRDGLMFVRLNPVFGIGREEFGKESGQVAHNSYIQAFGEMGLFGGALFLGAFLFALRSVERLCPDRQLILDPDLRHMQPYILGGLASYMMGMFTLSLTYVLPTINVLAIAAVFARMAPVQQRWPDTPFNLRFVGRSLLASLLFLVAMSLFLRLTRS
jgi:O-antigen ligase